MIQISIHFLTNPRIFHAESMLVGILFLSFFTEIC